MVTVNKLLVEHYESKKLSQSYFCNKCTDFRHSFAAVIMSDQRSIGLLLKPNISTTLYVVSCHILRIWLFGDVNLDLRLFSTTFTYVS